MKYQQEHLLRLFAYDPSIGIVTRKIDAGNRKAGTVVGTKMRHTLAVCVSYNGQKSLFPLARVIWVMEFGSIPAGYVIDHINGNPFDNRLVNLRAVPQSINGRNLSLKRNNKSGYNGVYWREDKKRWAAEMWVDGKKHWLGHFDTAVEANAARVAIEGSYGFHENHGKRRSLIQRSILSKDSIRGGEECPSTSTTSKR